MVRRVDVSTGMHAHLHARNVGDGAFFDFLDSFNGDFRIAGPDGHGGGDGERNIVSAHAKTA
ncbi:hypothetical protein D3C83_274510 [compost metagenome]